MTSAQLYRVLDRHGNLHRATDGRTRFPYLKACIIANRIGGRAIV